MNIFTALNKDFVIIDLGSSIANDNPFLSRFFPAITSIEIDAIVPSGTTTSRFHKSIKLNKGIHTDQATKTFFERKLFVVSSFLHVHDDVARMYGIEDAVQTVNEHQMECTTLTEILTTEQISRVDFLKTDLEGLDDAILRSVDSYMSDILVIQSELRFQPLFETEPYFYETCSYLNEHGFDLISLRPEYWKPKTTHSSLFRDGRVVWGDFIFFQKLDKHRPDFGACLLRQVLIAKSLGLNAYATYLFENNQETFDPEVAAELYSLLKPKGWLGNALASLFNALSGVPGYSLFRKAVKSLYFKSWNLHAKYPWVASH